MLSPRSVSLLSRRPSLISPRSLRLRLAQTLAATHPPLHDPTQTRPILMVARWRKLVADPRRSSPLVSLRTLPKTYLIHSTDDQTDGSIESSVAPGPAGIPRTTSRDNQFQLGTSRATPPNFSDP
jgi:hypothetical protein